MRLPVYATVVICVSLAVDSSCNQGPQEADVAFLDSSVAWLQVRTDVINHEILSDGSTRTSRTAEDFSVPNRSWAQLDFEHASLLANAAEEIDTTSVREHEGTLRSLSLRLPLGADVHLASVLSRTGQAIVCICPLLLGAIGIRYMQSRQQAKHANALAGLRALLMLLIFAYHAGIVQLCFVGAFITLSGAVLSLSSKSAKQESTSSANEPVAATAVGASVLRRWLLILPAACLSVAIPTKTDMFMQFWSQYVLRLRGIPMFVLGLGNLPNAEDIEYLWFVQCILFMYAFFPLLERALLHVRAAAGVMWWLSLISGCLCLKLVIIAYTWSSFKHGGLVHGSWYVVPQFPSPAPFGPGLSLYTCPLLWVPDFLVGMVLPYIKRATCQAPDDETHFKLVDTSLLCGLVLIMMIPTNAFLITCANLHVFLPLTALLIWSLLPGTGWSSRVLSIRVFAEAGDYTFSFYLCHVFVLYWLNAYKAEEMMHGSPVAYGLRFNLRFDAFAALCVSMLFAWAYHIVVERPLSRAVTVMFHDEQRKAAEQATEAVQGSGEFVVAKPGTKRDG